MNTIKGNMFVFVKAKDIFTISTCKPYYALYYDVQPKEIALGQVRYIIP